MKCLILAAGYATRLYPLTENFPKPLLVIKEKTIIDHLIDDLENGKNIDEYIVVSNHKFINHFNEWKKTRNENIIVLDDGIAVGIGTHAQLLESCEVYREIYDSQFKQEERRSTNG